MIDIYPNFNPIKEFAKYLNVSEKTLARDIVELNNEFLDENKIVSKRGQGIALDASIDEQIILLNKIQNEGLLQKHYVIPNKLRPYYCLLMIILDDPIRYSQNDLAQLLYISKSIISTDLNKIEDSVDGLGLRLMRTSEGTYIEGEEFDKRHLSVKLLMELLKAEKKIISEISINLMPDHMQIFNITLDQDEYDLIDNVIQLVDALTRTVCLF